MTIISRAAKVKETTIHAIVTRADGRIEDLGVISRRCESPLERAATAVRNLFKGLRQ